MEGIELAPIENDPIANRIPIAGPSPNANQIPIAGLAGKTEFPLRAKRELGTSRLPKLVTHQTQAIKPTLKNSIDRRGQKI